MRNTLALLASAALLVLPLSVRADIVKYNVVGGTFTGTSTLGVVQNGTITGTVSIDTTTKLVDATFLNFSSSAGTASYVSNSDEALDTIHTGYTSYDLSTPGQNVVVSDHFDFAISSGLYTGGAICSTSSLCTGGVFSTFTIATNTVTFTCGNPANCPIPIVGASPLNGNYSISAGSLVDPNAIAATPEPSSLILLGTGLFGVAGAARRRFLNR